MAICQGRKEARRRRGGGVKANERLAVKVVLSAPPCSAPCSTAASEASDSGELGGLAVGDLGGEPLAAKVSLHLHVLAPYYPRHRVLHLRLAQHCNFCHMQSD